MLISKGNQATTNGDRKMDIHRFKRWSKAMDVTDYYEDMTKDGKPNVRWSQARCGYVIFSGRSHTSIQSFDSEDEAERFIQKAKLDHESN